MLYRPTGVLVVSQKDTQHLFKVQTQWKLFMLKKNTVC